jgi:hypothetical protein
LFIRFTRSFCGKEGQNLRQLQKKGVQGFLECVNSDFKQHVRSLKVILDAPQELDSRVSRDEGKNMEHFNVDREAHKTFSFLKWWTYF